MKFRQTFWVILLILAGALLGIWITRAGIYYRIMYFCLLLIGLSWVMAKLSVHNIEIQRMARGSRQQLGDVFEEQFEIENNSKISRAWLEIEDGSGLPGSGSTRVLSWLKPKSARNYSGYVLLTKRGEYRLSPTIISSGDPFGLFLNQKSFFSDQTLLVVPYLVDIVDFPSPYGRLPGGIAVRRRTPQVEPPRVASVREHAPGDALNRIHWPTSARRDRLMVKEFEQDPQADIWVFLDAEKDVHIGEPVEHMEERLDESPLWWLNRSAYALPKDTFEYSVCAAASICKYYLRNEQVLGFASAGQNRIILSSERGERQLSKILETLAHIQSAGKLPLLGLVKSQAQSIPKGSTVVLITPSTDEGVTRSIVELIRRGMNPVLVLIDPISFGVNYDTKNVLSAAGTWNIPVILIRYGDNIKEKLEQKGL